MCTNSELEAWLMHVTGCLCVTDALQYTSGNGTLPSDQAKTVATNAGARLRCMRQIKNQCTRCTFQVYFVHDRVWRIRPVSAWKEIITGEHISPRSATDLPRCFEASCSLCKGGGVHHTLFTYSNHSNLLLMLSQLWMNSKDDARLHHVFLNAACIIYLSAKCENTSSTSSWSKYYLFLRLPSIAPLKTLLKSHHGGRGRGCCWWC
jgi:hypothetical protein